MLVHALVFCGSPYGSELNHIHRIIVLVYLSRHCPKFFSFSYLLSLTEFSSLNEPVRHPEKTVRADVPNKRSDILHSHTDSAHFPTVSSDRRRFERYNPSYRTVWTIKRSSRVNHSPVLAVKSALPGATRLHGL